MSVWKGSVLSLTLLLPRCVGQPPQDRSRVIVHLAQVNTHQQTKESIQMEELYSTEGDYGLRTLSEPDEAYVEYVTPYRYHFGTLN